MKFKQNVVEQFLWESYNIDSWKYLIKRLEESDESKIREIGKNVIIQHKFQIRRVFDPGFRYHILDQIKKDISSVKTVENYIEKLLLDSVHFDACKTFSPNPKNDCNENLHRKTVDENLKHIPLNKIEFEDRGDGLVNLIQKISDESLANNLKTSIEYFNQRYEMAREEGDELTATAIKYVIYEYETGMFSLFDLNKRPKFYWENVNKEVIFEWLRYDFKNINFIYNYYFYINLSDFLYPGTIIGLMGSLEFEDSLVSLLERFDFVNQGKEIIHNLEYRKFLYDAFSIASTIWFNSLDLKEKEKLLNGNYDLNPKRVTELITKITYISDNLDTLSYFAMECFANGFFDIAVVVYESIHNNSDDMYKKSECMDKIGDIHREKLDYICALDYYRKAYEYSNKILTTRRVNHKHEKFQYRINRKYGTIIESLRMAEMEYMLGKTDISDQHISEMKEKAKISNIDERLSILWNIACTFKRTGQYEKEYLCLEEMAELGKDRRKDLVAKADQRLLFLNNYFNNYNFKLDTKNLTEHDLREKKDRILKVADSMRRSFQFEGEIEYIKNVLNIENDANLRLEMAFCYYNLKKMDFAELELKKAIDDTEIPKILAFCHLYLAFIHFKHNKNDNGFIELEKAVRYGISSEKTFEIIEHCIFRLLRFKNEKLLKQALETVLNVVKTECSVENYFSVHLITSRYLLRCGLVSDAEYFAEIAVEKSSHDPELKMKSLRNMAWIYSNKDDYKKSIEYLEQAASISPKLPDIWEDIASAYSNLLDFKQAEECIDKALVIQPDDEKYKKLKDDYRKFGHDIIDFKKITDEDVKKYFFTAERIILEFPYSLDEKEFDFSMSLVSYGKGLETMLHNRISRPLRYKMHKEHGTTITEKYYLPKSLIKIFQKEEMTIQLGSWRYILDDCKKIRNEEIFKKSRDYFEGKLNKNKEKIFNACDFVSNDRNGAAHYTSKPKDEILNIRKEIIEQINNVINALYS